MTFEKFLTEAKKIEFWNKPRPVCFTGTAYPLLFLSKVFYFLQSEGLLEKPSFISIDGKSGFEISNLLNQSFLGQTSTYFFGELKEDKRRAKVINEIINYQGMHKVLFFIPKDNALLELIKKADIIELEDNIDQKLFIKLIKFFGRDALLNKKILIDSVFKRTANVSLESASTLQNYMEVVGVHAIKEFTHYLSFILEPEKSFFTLSNYFFSRNKVKFFELWEKIYDDYSPLFWIAYWSDQIWRAYYVCKFMGKDNVYQAKRMSMRLPFSFTRSYWKGFSLKELSNEIQFLYSADYALKTGSTFPHLDLFYSKHFSKEFIET